jgi:hypothetical protein
MAAEVFFFSGVGNLRFCRGFCEKRCAERGYLMVKSWWNAGKRWSENDLKSALKIFHGFQVYFLGFPVLGMGRVGLTAHDSSHNKVILAGNVMDIIP